jgi:2-hydroxycyclohexanecarboxyl-CoA dehydrogenase
MLRTGSKLSFVQLVLRLTILEFIQQNETGKKIISSMEKYIPLKRLGKPEDIAPIVAFLSSDLSSYITGQVISVSGGLTMM